MRGLSQLLDREDIFQLVETEVPSTPCLLKGLPSKRGRGPAHRPGKGFDQSPVGVDDLRRFYAEPIAVAGAHGFDYAHHIIIQQLLFCRERQAVGELSDGLQIVNNPRSLTHLMWADSDALTVAIPGTSILRHTNPHPR